REVPESLRRVVMRLLEKSAEDRFPDAASLDKALAACEAACRDVPPLTLGKVKPFVAGAKKSAAAEEKLPMLAIGASVLFVSLMVLGGVLFWGRSRHNGTGELPPKVEPVVST